MTIDTSGWQEVGESLNSRYFVIEDRVLGAVPHPGSRDDEKSARSNVAFQNRFFEEAGRGGVVVVFFDTMVSQDKDARRVYQTEPQPEWMLGTALVGGTMLSRAIGSFFMGLTKPEIPVRMFSSLEEAMAWAHGLIVRADSTKESP